MPQRLPRKTTFCPSCGVKHRVGKTRIDLRCGRCIDAEKVSLCPCPLTATTPIQYQILRERKRGLRLKEIARKFGVSDNTVIYYCTPGYKARKIKRNRKYSSSLKDSVKSFHYEWIKSIGRKRRGKNKSGLKRRVYNFVTRKNGMTKKFTYKDVINKFGEKTKCYLTGDDIDLSDGSTFEADHIIPVSRGGDNSFENFGLCSPVANRCKNNLTPEEFYQLCKKVVENYESNGGFS